MDALDRLVNKVLPDLAKETSIHNFNVVTATKKQSMVFAVRPMKPKGCKGQHILKFWQKVRYHAAFKNGKPRKTILNVVTYSSDAASFSLSAGIRMMTPHEEDVKNGVKYLSLGLPDELHFAPYYWCLPSIFISDADHVLRCFLRFLKSDTRDLTFYKARLLCPVTNNIRCVKVTATIQHLEELRHECESEKCNLRIGDLILVKYHDQNTNAAHKIFNPKIADLLDEYVPHSNGTSLYIRAVYSLLRPYISVDLKTYEDVMESASTGIHVLRLWKKYLEITKKECQPKGGGRKGIFISLQTYHSSELLYTGVISYLLTLYLHFPGKLQKFYCPINTGTLSTERLISELQGKSTHMQCLDAQPTFMDIINRLSVVEDNKHSEEHLQEEGIQIPESNHQRVLNHQYIIRDQCAEPPTAIPESYSRFKETLIHSISRGKEKAKEMIKKYLPEEFLRGLESIKVENSNASDYPYLLKDKYDFTFEIVDKPPERTFNIIHQEVTVESENESESEEESARYVDCGEERCHGSKDESSSSECDETSTKQSKWYISHKVGDKMEKVHVMRAISMLIPREYVSRERSKRHIASIHLPGKTPLKEGHDIIRFRDYLTRHGDCAQLIRLVHLQDSEGTCMNSCRRRDKSFKFHGRKYETTDDGNWIFTNDIIISGLKSVGEIILEVVLQKDERRVYILSDNSKSRIVQKGYSPVSFKKLRVERDSTSSKGEEVDSDGHDGDGFYLINDVRESRWNRKTHMREYRASFKGYGSEDDIWLPEYEFLEPVSLVQKSSRGRPIKHKMYDENILERKTSRSKYPDRKILEAGLFIDIY